MIWKNVRERKGLYMGLTHFDENGKAYIDWREFCEI